MPDKIMSDKMSDEAMSGIAKSGKIKIMILQTRHIESISYLTAELVQAFSSDRYHVTLVYLESGTPNEIDNLADDCFFLGLAKTDYKGLRLKAIRKIRPFLLQHHFDVIIANMYKPVHLLMQTRRSVSASLCIGIIHAFGEFDRFGRRWMMRFALDDRWKMVGVSDAVRQYLINARCGLNEKNTLTINNAIDVKTVSENAFDRTTAREKLQLPQDGLVFGTLARSVKGKRQLELVKAFHQFAQERNNVFLAIIGDGECRAELDEYIVTHQLHDKVFLAGYLESGARYLRAFDVFVFPSESEGFGIALLEAMALALPAIVNRVEPLISIAGDDGMKVDSANIALFARALQAISELTDDQRLAMGLRNYQRALELYNVDGYRTQYCNLVERFF